MQGEGSARRGKASPFPRHAGPVRRKIRASAPREPRATPASPMRHSFGAGCGTETAAPGTPQCRAWLFSMGVRHFFTGARLFSGGTRHSTEPRMAPLHRRAGLSRSRLGLRGRHLALSGESALFRRLRRIDRPGEGLFAQPGETCAYAMPLFLPTSNAWVAGGGHVTLPRRPTGWLSCNLFNGVNMSQNLIDIDLTQTFAKNAKPTIIMME